MTGELTGAAVTAIFACGGFFYMVRRMKRDLNGIGKRLAEKISRDARRNHNVALAIVAAAAAEKQTEVAAILREEF